MMRKIVCCLLLGAVLSSFNTQAQWLIKAGMGAGKPFQAQKVGNRTFVTDEANFKSQFGWDQWLTLEAGRFLHPHISLNVGFIYLNGAKGRFDMTSNYINQEVTQYSRAFLISPSISYFFLNKKSSLRPFVSVGPSISIRPKLYRDDHYVIHASNERVETAMYFNMPSTFGYQVRLGANYKLMKGISLNIEMSMQRMSSNQIIEVKNEKRKVGEYTKYTINGIEAPESSRECTSCEFGSVVKHESINDGLVQYNALSNIGLLLGLQWNF
jgi:outer membrane protein W